MGVSGLAVAGLATVVMVVSSAGPALADAPKWGAHLDFEGRWGEGRSLGDVGLFAPLWQSSVSLLFADLRFKFDDEDSREGNFGLGLRHMMANGWNVGAYGYFDRRRSGTGQYFNQATLGLEALSADWDLRANAYLPFGERTKSLGTSGGGAPFAELASGTIQVVTPGLSERLERALTGFDGEIGWRLPLFSEGSLAQLRAYAGGYWFDGGGLVDDIYGPRGRLELSFDDLLGLRGARFTLGGEVQHDDLRGTQAFATARLRIPLQAPDTPLPKLTAQEARMTARVVRDVDIVSGVGTVVTPETREAAINTYNNETVTSAVQVDAGSGQAALQNAITAAGAGGVVILNGSVAVAASTTMAADGTLLGGGAVLPVQGAASGAQVNFIAPGAAGAIRGGVVGDLLNLAPNSAVGGLTLQNDAVPSLSATILGANAPGAVVFGNNITITESTNIAVLMLGSSGMRVIGNVIEAGSGSNGIVISGSSNNSIISGNTITSGGNGIQIENSSGITVSGNIVSSDQVGLGMSNATGMTISDNSFGQVGFRTINLGNTVSFTADSIGNTWTGQGPTLCWNSATSTSGSVQFTDVGNGSPGSCP